MQQKNPAWFLGLSWAVSRRNMQNFDFLSCVTCDKTADIDKSIQFSNTKTELIIPDRGIMRKGMGAIGYSQVPTPQSVVKGFRSPYIYYTNRTLTIRIHDIKLKLVSFVWGLQSFPCAI